MKRRVVIATPALAPTAVLAHASERAVILTLPTGPYIWGAGSAVAISAVVAAFSNRLPTPGQRRLFDRPLLLPEGAVSWLSAIGLGLLILVGLLGTILGLIHSFAGVAGVEHHHAGGAVVIAFALIGSAGNRGGIGVCHRPESAVCGGLRAAVSQCLDTIVAFYAKAL